MTSRRYDASQADDIGAWLDALERRVAGLRGRTPLPARHDDAARQVDRDEDLVTRFAHAAARIGVRVTRAAAEDWPDAVVRQARQLGGRRAGLCFAPDAWPAGTIELLRRRLEPAFDTLLCDPPAEAWATVDLTITDVSAAVAESGSLVWDSGPQRPRVATLLPRAHLAVVRAGQIVPDLLDLWDEPPASPPAQRVLITGPSKTADIEGVLVTGVHGPGAVEVVVIENL